MIVAEELDVNWEEVVVEQAPLNSAFERQVAGGSGSIRSSWNALRTAGATARQMLVNAAAKQWQVAPETCSTSNSVITSESGKEISYGEIASLATQEAVPDEVKLKEPEEFSKLVKEIHPDDPAFLVFTSGTTGPPKPATITHRNILISFVYAFSEVFPKLITEEQRSVSHLSLAHIFERSVSIYFPLLYDCKPHIGAGVEYLQETLFEVQPTFFHGVPRIWEKMAAQIVVGIESSSWLKKSCYQWAMRIGWRYMGMKWKAEKVAFIWQLLRWIAYQISFRHILHQVGLIKTTSALSTGAPLPPQIQRLWQVWGLDLVNLYGSTEVAGIISSQRPGFAEPGDLGKPTTVNEVSLAEDGELTVSGPGVFAGYWNDEEKTRELWKPVFKREDYRLMRDTGELACIRDLQDHLETTGLVFDRRVLYAFHTALKVNDISPLVVLRAAT